jgi:hypothetical protein
VCSGEGSAKEKQFTSPKIAKFSQHFPLLERSAFDVMVTLLELKEGLKH